MALPGPNGAPLSQLEIPKSPKLDPVGNADLASRVAALPAKATPVVPTTSAPGGEVVIRATAPLASDPPAGRANTPASSEAPAAPKQIDGAEKIRELHQQAVTKYAGIQDYVARFRRREFVNGQQQPEDLVELKYRKDPNSVHFKWLQGTANEGREILYVHGKGNLMQVKSGKGDLMAGVRVEIDPTSERATANSRRTIKEAGIGNVIDRFGVALADQAKGAKTYGPLHYLGPQQRPESQTPLECVAQQVPPGLEKHLPKGGLRYWFFCTDARTKEYGLPVLVLTYDETRREVEYYCYDRLNTSIGLRIEDFDPNEVWRKR